MQGRQRVPQRRGKQMRIVEIRGFHDSTAKIAVNHDSIALGGAGKTSRTWNFKRDLRKIVSFPKAL